MRISDWSSDVCSSDLAQSAFSILQEDRPIDLLFTDIVMPGSLSGVQLVERAKELRPEIKVLLTSGFAKVAMENASCGRPTGTLLSKPYRLQDLAQAVSEVKEADGRAGKESGWTCRLRWAADT